MSDKKHRSTKRASKKAASKKVGGGRVSAFSGKKITKLAKDNPRRQGTAGHKSFSLINNGMTYEQYVAAGGRRQDLAFDLAHKYVSLSK